MKAFSDLYVAIDSSTKTTEKVNALAAYFWSTKPEDAAWTVQVLTGNRPKRPITTTLLRQWAMEEAGLDPWLFTECYDAVGDLAETINLVLPEPSQESSTEDGLSIWIKSTLIDLAKLPVEVQRERVTQTWKSLPSAQRFVWLKLITGSFRVGVSKELVIKGLAIASGIPSTILAHRLSGTWTPTATAFQALISPAESEYSPSQPFPFCLAYPVLESELLSLGEPKDWIIEWKWDGIRSQIIRRSGETFIWSRGEELITDRFPEIRSIADALPDGTVLDGEILGMLDGEILPFGDLQRRIGRKTVGKKLLSEVPVALIAFDILELEGKDLRNLPLIERRAFLNQVAAGQFQVAERHEANTWEEVAQLRQLSFEKGVEGLMLKAAQSTYQVGRKRGHWWKWKVDPFTVDAVLIYAQRGSGRRASLYSDYTFAVWRDGALVPIAKAYSGLTDEEMKKVDAFVRANTLDKFGPVRTVTPQLVFEIAFEGIQKSTRHKSGIAVRFPRIHRWRHDKTPEQADTMESLLTLLESRTKEKDSP